MSGGSVETRGRSVCKGLELEKDQHGWRSSGLRYGQGADREAGWLGKDFVLMNACGMWVVVVGERLGSSYSGSDAIRLRVLKHDCNCWE